MKQTYFTIKNLGGNLPEKQFTIVKRSFRSSTKPLSLNSTIPVDELTTETFYRFRTSKLFNIWTPPFLMHGSQYVTNQRCIAPSTWLTHQLEEDCCLQSSSLHQQWRSRSTWLQNTRVHMHSNFFTRDELGRKLCLQSQFAWTNFSQCLCNLWTLWRPLK